MAIKGFFFSLDSLFAIIIAIVIISGTLFFASKGQDDKFTRLYLTKLANDALIVLNKNNILDTLDASSINTSLVNILPKSMAFDISITPFQCKDSNCQDFTEVSSQKIDIKYPMSSEEINPLSARREFLVFENSRIKYFAIAELRVWLL